MTRRLDGEELADGETDRVYRTRVSYESTYLRGRDLKQK